MASFELDRRSDAGSAVAPLGVVDHLKVVEDVGAGVVAGRVDLAAEYPAATLSKPLHTSSGT